MFFERLDTGMTNNLKPLFIRAYVENVRRNNVLINGGATVNLMPHILIKKIGKYDIDLRPHNMVLSNYEGKKRHVFGVIQVDVTIGSITRPAVFMVIASKES